MGDEVRLAERRAGSSRSPLASEGIQTKGTDGLQPASFARTNSRAFSSAAGILLGVLAAGLGEVGPAAAAAADDRGDVLEPLAGVQAAGDQVGGQAGGEVDLAVGDRGQEHGQAGARLAAEDVDQLPELVGRGRLRRAAAMTFTSPSTDAAASRSSAETCGPSSALRWAACFLRVLISSSRAATRSATRLAGTFRAAATSASASSSWRT